MELWIRNQEKDHLIKIEEINIEIDDDGFVGIWSYGSNKYLKWYLGNYATKERALEVLDEIQNLMRSLTVSNLKIIQYDMPNELERGNNNDD